MDGTATETFQRLKHTYGGNAVSCTRVFEWYATFLDVPENLAIDEHRNISGIDFN
jgi:hypothetical protein